VNKRTPEDNLERNVVGGTTPSVIPEHWGRRLCS
jgi:hypothetical protein